MKVLILSDPYTAGFKIGRTPIKFMLMIEAIKQGGLEGTHYYVGTAGELKALKKRSIQTSSSVRLITPWMRLMTGEIFMDCLK